jgi:hypothetical protein
MTSGQMASELFEALEGPISTEIRTRWALMNRGYVIGAFNRAREEGAREEFERIRTIIAKLRPPGEYQALGLSAQLRPPGEYRGHGLIPDTFRHACDVITEAIK